MRNNRVQFAVGVGISAFFLWLTLRPVNFHEMWEALRGLHWAWAVPFLAVTFASLYVRAIRWHFLLRPTAILPANRLFSPLVAGFAINSMLPARAGEFARAYILGRRESLAFTSVFATVVVERIYDSFTLLIMLAVVFANLRFDPDVHYSYSTKSQFTAGQILLAINVAAGVAILIAVATFLLLRHGVRDRLISRLERGRHPHRGVASVCLKVLRQIERLGPPAWFDGIWILLVLVIAGCLWLAYSEKFGPPPVTHFGKDYEISGASLRPLAGKITIVCVIMLAGSLVLLWGQARRAIQGIVEAIPWAPRGFRVKVSELLGTFAHGLSSLRDIRGSAMVLLLSAVIWVTIGWSLQIIAGAFEGMHMSLLQGMAITVITCIFIIIPAAPGYWGLLELGTVFGMKILGVESDYTRALGFALVMHALQVFPLIAAGLFCLWREHISLGEISARETAA